MGEAVDLGVLKRHEPRGRHPDKRLTAIAVRRLGPGRYADGNGLWLDVDESGARRWFLRTLVHGRRRDIGLGGVSWVSLAEAREMAVRLRKVAREGGDPIAMRDKGKRTSMSFAEAAQKVHAEHIAANKRNAKHVAQWLATLEKHAFPVIGAKPVHAVEQADILRVLAPIWTERPETARRVRQRLRTVLDWARTAGHREGINPVEGVEKGLARQRDKPKHFAALPWQELSGPTPRQRSPAFAHHSTAAASRRPRELALEPSVPSLAPVQNQATSSRRGKGGPRRMVTMLRSFCPKQRRGR